MTIAPDDLQRCLPLANLPTPIEICQLLSQRYGVTLHLKRDDCTGGLHGGTKLRALEHLLHQAEEEQASDLITLGEATSSQCRLVAALGRRLGMRVHLLVREAATLAPTAVDNLEMMELLGAEIIFLTQSEWQLYPLAVRRLTGRLQRAGQRPYFIPFGCAGRPGTRGILGLVQELYEQQEQSFPFTQVVIAAGSGGTLFGFDLAFKVLPELRDSTPPQLLGLSLDESADNLLRNIDRYFLEWSQATSCRVSRSDHIRVDDRWAKLDPEARAAGLVKVASELGEIFDPLYVLPAFLGMLSMLEDQTLPSGASILFLVSGPCLHLASCRDQLGPALAAASLASGAGDRA